MAKGVAEPRTDIVKAPNISTQGPAAVFLDASIGWPTTVSGFYTEHRFKHRLRYFAIINLGPGNLYFRFSAEDQWAWLPPFAGFEHENINPPFNSVFIGTETSMDAFGQFLTVEVDD